MQRPRSRPMLVALGLLAIVVLGVSVWLGNSWLGTYRDAEATQAQVELLRQAASSQDWEATVQQVPEAAASARALATSTSSGQWSVLEALPVVGATASATRQLASAVAVVLTSVEALTPYADAVLSGELRDDSGAIRTSLLTESAPLLDALSTNMVEAESGLAAIDVSTVREPVASAITEYLGLAGEYSGTVDDAADLARQVPALLGADGPRDWLVMLQNPAESRGAGGFPGGYVIMRLDDGEISVASTGTSTDLRRTPIPYKDAPSDAKSLWGTDLGMWDTFNLSPHFPLTGELAAAGMAERDTPVSGVIAVDPAVVAALMTVTGPVKAKGQRITSKNVERFFLSDIYEVLPEDPQRDAVTLALAGKVIEAFLSSPLEPQILVDALREPVAEGRVRVWSAEPAEQAWLEETPVGGVLPDSAGPVVAVAFNNSAGSKMDAFMESAIVYEPGMCSGATRKSRLAVFLRNGAPEELPLETLYYVRMDDLDAPEGSTSLLVHVYLPVGAQVTTATLDGARLTWFGGDERGHPVAWLKVPVNRNQQREIEFAFDEPPVADVEPRLIVQPMAIDTLASVAPVGPCAS